MLTVTEDAKQLLKETLQAHTDDPETGLRLSVKAPGQLGITLDNEADGDLVVEHEGAKVLLVASELDPVLDGVTLDVQDEGEGPTLIVRDAQAGD